MGKGLSPLQARILKALAAFPTYEASVEAGEIKLRGWAEPKHLLDALDILPTPTNRVVLSKALARLTKRGLVAKWYRISAAQGNGAKYALITDIRNAGVRSFGPYFKCARPGPKAVQRTVGWIDGEFTAQDLE